LLELGDVGLDVLGLALRTLEPLLRADGDGAAGGEAWEAPGAPPPAEEHGKQRTRARDELLLRAGPGVHVQLLDASFRVAQALLEPRDLLLIAIAQLRRLRVRLLVGCGAAPLEERRLILPDARVQLQRLVAEHFHAALAVQPVVQVTLERAVERR